MGRGRAEGRSQNAPEDKLCTLPKDSLAFVERTVDRRLSCIVTRLDVDHVGVETTKSRSDSHACSLTSIVSHRRGKRGIGGGAPRASALTSRSVRKVRIWLTL